MARKNWSRITVNLDPALAAAVKILAARDRRSMAGYFQTLIEQDLAKRGDYPEAPDDASGVAEKAGKLAADEQTKRAAKVGTARGPRR